MPLLLRISISTYASGSLANLEEELELEELLLELVQ
jgi:hypothetical protein